MFVHSKSNMKRSLRDAGLDGGGSRRARRRGTMTDPRDRPPAAPARDVRHRCSLHRDRGASPGALAALRVRSLPLPGRHAATAAERAVARRRDGGSGGGRGRSRARWRTRRVRGDDARRRPPRDGDAAGRAPRRARPRPGRADAEGQGARRPARAGACAADRGLRGDGPRPRRRRRAAVRRRRSGDPQAAARRRWRGRARAPPRGRARDDRRADRRPPAPEELRRRNVGRAGVRPRRARQRRGIRHARQRAHARLHRSSQGRRHRVGRGVPGPGLAGRRCDRARVPRPPRRALGALARLVPRRAHHGTVGHVPDRRQRRSHRRRADGGPRQHRVRRRPRGRLPARARDLALRRGERRPVRRKDAGASRVFDPVRNGARRRALRRGRAVRAPLTPPRDPRARRPGPRDGHRRLGLGRHPDGRGRRRAGGDRPHFDHRPRRRRGGCLVSCLASLESPSAPPFRASARRARPSRRW